MRVTIWVTVGVYQVGCANSMARRIFIRDKYLPRAASIPVGTLTYEQDLVLAHPSGMTDN